MNNDFMLVGETWYWYGQDIISRRFHGGALFGQDVIPWISRWDLMVVPH